MHQPPRAAAAPPPDGPVALACDVSGQSARTKAELLESRLPRFNALRDAKLEHVADYLAICEPKLRSAGSYMRRLWERIGDPCDSTDDPTACRERQKELEREWERPYVPDPEHVFGQPCASASDRADCEARLKDVMRVADACDYAECDPFVVWTAGDDVGRFATTRSLAALMVPIDTPAKALALAVLHGMPLFCHAARAPSDVHTEIERRADGYRVQSWREPGCEDTLRTSLHVHVDGRISDVKSVKLAKLPGLICAH